MIRRYLQFELRSDSDKIHLRSKNVGLRQPQLGLRNMSIDTSMHTYRMEKSDIKNPKLRCRSLILCKSGDIQISVYTTMKYDTKHKNLFKIMDTL